MGRMDWIGLQIGKEREGEESLRREDFFRDSTLWLKLHKMFPKFAGDAFYKSAVDKLKDLRLFFLTATCNVSSYLAQGCTKTLKGSS